MGGIHIAIVIIRNGAGDFFVHRRRADKAVFAGLYGLGAGGRVELAETPAEGARRELFEETGIVAVPAFVASFPFVSGGVHYTVHLFQIRHEGPIANDDGEWSWSGWRSPGEVAALIATGAMCPDTAACHALLTGSEA